MDHTSTTPHSPVRSACHDQRIRVDDAVLPQDITRAVTFHGATPAWALLKRLKSLENRPYRLPCGGWIAVHVGSGSWRGDYAQQIEGCPSEEDLMNVYGGCIVGLFKVKECRRPWNCGANVWAEGPVCNVVKAVVELPSPIPIQKGKLSLWELDQGVRLQIASQVLDVASMDLSSLPLYEPIVGPITPGRNRSYNRTRSPSPTSTTSTPPPSSPRRPSSTEPPAWSIESAASPRYAAAQSFFAARYPHNDMLNWRQLMAVDDDARKRVALDLAFLPALARSTQEEENSESSNDLDPNEHGKRRCSRTEADHLQYGATAERFSVRYPPNAPGCYEPSWQNGAEPPGLPGFDADPGAPELPAPLSPPPRDVAEGVLAWIDGVRRAAGI